MQKTSEHVHVIDAVISLLLFLLVIAAVVVLIAFFQRREDTFIEDMKNAADSAKMARMYELEMQADPVLCTAVANVLQEFGDTELLYVQIAGDGNNDVYIYNGVNPDSTGVTIHQSNSPIEESIKKLLSFSDRTCKVRLEQSGQDAAFTYLVVVVN